jgi:hypothetical protein
MKYRVLTSMFALIFFQMLSVACNVDSSKIKSIEIMSFYFNRETRYSFDVSTMLKLRNHDHSDKKAFYRLLNESESLELEKKLNPILIKDSLLGINDNNIDLRFLMVLNYDGKEPSIYIGFGRGSAMFINGKRYKGNKMFLIYALDYITDKRLKKAIVKKIKEYE